MLKVIGSTKVNNVSIEVDEYVPLSFRCFEAASVSPLYWRTGDLQKSFIEFGLNNQTGAIFSVTVLLLPKVVRISNNEIDHTLNIVDELPICDIKEWDSIGYKDDPKEFITNITDNSISFWFEGKTELQTIYKVSNLIFGVDYEQNLKLLEYCPSNKLEIGIITAGL